MSEAEFIVIRALAGDVDLRCGGVAVVAADAPVPDRPDLAGEVPDGTVAIGKRYTDESGRLEVLCTRSGAGRLSLGESELTVKAAKALPSSD
ncbi:hypothetical protein [Thermocatellispora tengchongensis]|uniref:hypothetical protein n=1 Tax=Thermocatellispora tengchongensis TaxID=1073253 RepID=UPI00363918D5